MSRGRFLFACALLVAGCRGLIGIEEVEVDGGADAGGGTDAGSVDAPSGSDATKPPDVPNTASPPDAAACGSTTGTACLKCCKGTFQQETPKFEQQMIDNGCICGSGQCTDKCANSMCATPRTAPDITCAPCVDALIKAGGPNCGKAHDACKNDPSNGCINVAGCFDACR